ncbi:PSD1 and planctomycete cytochrome C domain-containing protein [Lacipirellula limnantheis]|uniref:Planctomycete cytochrome C n=1 Tax=Lacipirellula limnantheis TaxID=2528024 RepID=A0A517TYU5_9BACT|nr:PSD1 and planctomycete cytochrome C domain-containing protein [Lacipirellula limnantheis]QDT73548.1 Planctomycete cytochrome C [Lacipirellula limnantheis]
MWRVPILLFIVQFPAQLWAADNAADAVQFETHVRPILKANCWHCHGEAEEVKGSLDARLVRTLLQGGDSGPAITRGDHVGSLLYHRVVAGDMPPGEKKLTAAEIEVLARWIDQGANTDRVEPASLPTGPVIGDDERSHWSFQPVRRPVVPEVRHPALVRSPIDAFLLAGLEVKGLSFGAEADRPTLIRRLYFDLTGLPPSPSAVEQFVHDRAPDAYERLVDQLLGSPAYGEHWGRHWLDVVGYADSNGYSELDSPRKWAFRYRDYVIRSLNGDKPWNDFLVEQLAGDELLPQPLENLTAAQADQLIATGMLRMGPDGTSDGAVDQNLARNEVIANTIKIVSTSVLGLTVACAQCHDHRYDPISQADYYGLRAIFEPAFDWKNWRSPDARLVSLWTDETRKQAAAAEADLQEIDRQRHAELDQIVNQTFERELAKLPTEMQSAARLAHDTAADKRSNAQLELIKQHPFLNVDRSTVYLYLPDRLTEFNKRWDDCAETAAKKKPADDFVQCLTEIPGQIPATKLFARGDFNSPKQDIAPGELTVLNAQDFSIASDDPQLATSGRRLAYARHLTDGRHPLVARVLVNRFWLNHFGRGLVTTPADFGALGQPPSHPELLDWLADDFMAGGWKLKRLHRMIVTSTAYRQSSEHRAELDAVDPENRLLGRMPARRLQAEMLRDALLATSGRLSAKMFGPPVPITPDDVGQVVVGADTRDSSGRPTGKVVDLGEDEFRRSIYVQVQRSKPLGLLETFDAPTMSPNCEQRASSTNAPQSLMLMNNAFVLQQADEMAERIEREVGADLSAQFQRAWQMAYCRAPSASQLQAGLEFLGAQAAIIAANPAADPPAEPSTPSQVALSNLCQALVMSNGFLYVD